MLHLILGTMKAGKSTKLLSLAKEFSTQDVALIAPNVSKREFFARNVENCLEVYDESFDYANNKIVLIDEIQFFKKEYIQAIINNRNNYNFYIAGLLSNIYHQMWENVVKLLPYADNVELRYANCDICGCKKAKYHIGSGLIGDDYLVICEKCKIKEKR